MHKSYVRIFFSSLVEKILKNSSNETAARHVNVILLRIMSILLLLCAVSQSILGPLVYLMPTAQLLTDIGVFFISGIIVFTLSFLNPKPFFGNLLVALIYNLVFFYSLVRYYEYMGPAMWTFAFIIILISIARLTRTMLVVTGVALTVSLLYLRFFANLVNFPVDDVKTIVNFLLFGALYFIARLIYGVNIRRLEVIDNQVNELNAQIEERKKVEAENLRLALYDHLTGLPNRMLFTENLKYAIEHKTSGSGLYVMFIDLDFFKRVNDTLGHSSGDELIKQAGDRISAIFRSSDSVCRVSGDEFLVMVRNIRSEKQVLNMAKRVLEQFNEPFIINMRRLAITCSVGIAKHQGNDEDVEALIKRADFAMYRAKTNGKNRYVLYSSELEKDVIEEIEKINALHEALANDEFLLYYQPQVNGLTKEIIGYEALIRWNHPERGILLPGEFIPAAEKSGLIIPIGEWVIKTACRQNKAWQDMGLPKVPVSVNISAIQVNNNSLYNLVRDVLDDTKLSPEYLELEITESTIISDENILSGLEAVKSLGVKIAIDDFGTGYSAIQYLKSFPVDRIKIPMDFVHGINLNQKDESIINVILALADSLDIDVIAEGVENESQLKFLSERSCSNIQGYFFYEPVPAEVIPKYCGHKQ
jgi:diguanylate cyclase (GGDEF)-like protein